MKSTRAALTKKPLRNNTVFQFAVKEATARPVDLQPFLNSLRAQFPKKEIIVLPPRVLTRKGVKIWQDSRIRIKGHPFALNDPTLHTVKTITEKGSTIFHSWPSFSAITGQAHEAHIALYWKSKGVTSKTLHTKIPSLPSPRDGWRLVQPKVGIIFKDQYSRQFIIAASPTSNKPVLLQFKGSYDSMYRATNLIQVQFVKATKPKGALEFIGILPSNDDIELFLSAVGTRKAFGTKERHHA